MMHAAPLPSGVFFFERGWLSANNVLCVGASGATLIDSGYCTHSSQTVALVERALGSLPLLQLLNTHLHSDHCGGNAALQYRFPAVHTFIPPGSAGHVRKWDAQALGYVATGQDCPPFELTGTLEPGADYEIGDQTWQIHAAPGHDPHSVIMFEPQSRTLISADALWEDGFGVIFPELDGARAFDEVSDTLLLIESLRPNTIIPGHGPIFTDVEQALTRARSRLNAFVEEPFRHARYAAKVLLKFKLLQSQQMTAASLFAWAMTAPYFHTLNNRWFSHTTLQSWLGDIVTDMARSGAVVLREGVITNT